MSALTATSGVKPAAISFPKRKYPAANKAITPAVSPSALWTIEGILFARLAPRAWPTRTLTACASPKGTINVVAATESAIWCAASGTTPNQPIMSDPKENPVTSHRLSPAVWIPILRRCQVSFSTPGASQATGQASFSDCSKEG